MIVTLQLTEELEVSWALLVMAETKECLERICKDEKGVSKEVQAACFFLLSNLMSMQNMSSGIGNRQ